MPLYERSKAYKPNNIRWIKFKLSVLSKLDRFPILKDFVIYIRRTTRWLFLKYVWKLKALVDTNNRELDIDKIYWVDPKKIRYCSLNEFNIYKYKGKVIGGNWDHLEKKFEELDIYIALKEVCTEGKNWHNTIFYKRVINKLKTGEILWGCKNKTELDRRCKDLELLYQKIKNEGYKSQYEMSVLGSEFNPLKIEDEITLSVGRYGDLLFSNGAHRLAIAKLLGIEKVPVKIAVIHPQWVKSRKEIFPIG